MLLLLLLKARLWRFLCVLVGRAVPQVWQWQPLVPLVGQVLG